MVTNINSILVPVDAFLRLLLFFFFFYGLVLPNITKHLTKIN